MACCTLDNLCQPPRPSLLFVSILLILVGCLLWVAFGVQLLYVLFTNSSSYDQLFTAFLSNYSNVQLLTGLLFSVELLIFIQMISIHKNHFELSEFLINSLIWLIIGLFSIVVSIFMILIVPFLEIYFLSADLLTLIHSSIPFVIMYCAGFVLLIFYRFTKKYDSKMLDLLIQDKIKLGLLFFLLGLVGGTLAGILVLTGSLIMLFDALSQKFSFF